jgi:hypothetical protein
MAMTHQDQEPLREFSEEKLQARGIEGTGEELLRRKGIDMSMGDVFELFLSQVADLPDVDQGAVRRPEDEETREKLSALGVSLEPFEGEDDPLATSIAAYTDLLASSLTTAEAAALMGVGNSRVRQLLGGECPRLYGIKKDRRGSWRLPRFQFDEQGLIPGIDQVLPELPRDLHPLEVVSWFRSPSPDLITGDGARHSPLQWLRAGHPVEAVVDIAKKLD